MPQLISQLCLEMTVLSLSCAFFIVVKSYSKQNSQAPDETCLWKEFSCQSIDWCFAKRHVLKPRTPSNSSPNFAEIRKKMGFLGITHRWNILWGWGKWKGLSQHDQKCHMENFMPFSRSANSTCTRGSKPSPTKGWAHPPYITLSHWAPREKNLEKNKTKQKSPRLTDYFLLLACTWPGFICL